MDLLSKVKKLMEEVEAMTDAYPIVVAGCVPDQKKKKKKTDEENEDPNKD